MDGWPLAAGPLSNEILGRFAGLPFGGHAGLSGLAGLEALEG